MKTCFCKIAMIVLAALLIGAATTNLQAATFSDDNWSSIGSIRNAGPLPRSVGGVDAAATDVFGNLYVGGEFTIAGGVFATNIAKWNGSTWSALGLGIDGEVVALLASGRDLYAAGAFTTAGASAAKNIAKWNGSSWSPLGSGMNGTVLALAVSDGELYAGGFFTTAGGYPANHIAKWNGTCWSPLGSGMNGGVDELAVSGGNLHAGGSFTTAGGKVSAYLARAYLDSPTLSILRSGGDMTLSWPVSFGRFALQQNPDASNPNGWSSANYPLLTNGATASATVPVTPTNQFFRLIGN